MQRVLVWDLPVRLFHWLLVGTIIATLAIALGTDSTSPAFPLHMLLGLIAGFMVVLRLLWGVIGSRYARFSSFLFGPRAVGRYMLGTVTHSPARWIGHNPGSSYSIYAMLALIVALGVTGPLTAAGFEATKELHEVLGDTLLGVALAHLLGVIWHTVRHRENLIRSMVDGRKAATPEQGIESSHPVVAVLFVALVAGAATLVATNYDSRTRTLAIPLWGRTLHLGKYQDHGGKAGQRRHDRAPREERDRNDAEWHD